MDEKNQTQTLQQRASQGAASKAVQPRYDTTFSAAPPIVENKLASPSPAAGGWKLAITAAGVLAAGVAGLFAGKPSEYTGDIPFSAEQNLARTRAFEALGPVRLKDVTSGERAAAMQTMLLPVAEREALEKDLEGRKSRLVWLILWDDQVEDNDVVAIETEGFARTVALTRAPQRIVVPVPNGSGLTIKGVQDGRGGGITVAVELESGPIPLPIMRPGEQRLIQVAAP